MMAIRRRRRAESALVADCEAFLSGQYAEHLVERGSPAPGWVWLNLVAHGTLDDLAAARDRRRRGGPLMLYSHWLAARSYVIGEVCDALDAGGESLPALQQRVLRPLEAQLAAKPSAARFPRDLVTRVLHALEADEREHRGRPRR